MDHPPIHRRVVRRSTRPRPDQRTPAALAGGDAAALAVAALVVACLVWTAGKEPLPALPWAAAFLFVAVWQDVRQLRIPNWLTFPFLGIAIALAAAQGGWSGMGAALAGGGAGLGVLLLPFLLGWLGAGDVKAAMVLGALWGGDQLLPTLWWMLVVGGVLAIALITARGGLLDLLRRWGGSLQLTLVRRRWTYLPPAASSAAASGLPFAIAMGLGAAAYQLWGLPWA